MGGAGGAMGGGAVLIEAETEFVLNGNIYADGQSGPSGGTGGGAGGGVLIRSLNVTINGWMYARGGNGGYSSGGGSGGAIKVFYGNETLPSFSARALASGGSAGGDLNTQWGGAGAVYRDHIPRVNQFLAPTFGEAITNGIVTFQWTSTDSSQAADGHRDSLTPLIELSTDGFQTIAYSFNQANDTSGWNRLIYYSGDLIQYVPLVSIANGVYQWRVALRDESLWSRYSAPRVLVVGTSTPISTIAADLYVTPTVVIKGMTGTTCRIDWVDSMSEANTWSTLATVPVVSNPQLYFDTSGIGQPKRFYRLVQIP